MKKLPFLCFFLVSTVNAQEPSKEAVSSCLLNHSASPKISVSELPTNEVLSQDNYQSGYAAPYYFQAGGMDIGYAQKGKQSALIYAGKLYPLMKAKPTFHTTAKPTTFDPELADWSQIKDQSSQYLCVSFNFEGLGRSGSFQGVRGGYLLSIPATGAGHELFFVIANTKNFPHQ